MMLPSTAYPSLLARRMISSARQHLPRWFAQVADLEAAAFELACQVARFTREEQASFVEQQHFTA